VNNKTKKEKSKENSNLHFIIKPMRTIWNCTHSWYWRAM